MLTVDGQFHASAILNSYPKLALDRNNGHARESPESGVKRKYQPMTVLKLDSSVLELLA
jgi:hypothetical protein